MYWNDIIKMTTLSKALYRFNGVLIKISITFFRDIEQLLRNFYGITKLPEQSRKF